MTENLEKGSAESLESLEQAVQEGPEDAALLLRLGWAYYADGRLDEALKTLESASARSPDNLEVLYALGVASRRAGNFERARDVFARIGASAESGSDEPRLAMLKRLASSMVRLVAGEGG